MSNNKDIKDAWIKDAIARRYLIVNEDGTIYRCASADDRGNLTSKSYKLVAFQLHKKSGRLFFNLTWRGITKSVLVNRVVALRFHPNPLNLPQVNHKSGVKTYNHKDNLEWASASENEAHAHRTGLKSNHGSSNSNSKLTANQVLAIRASSDAPEVLAERYGVKRSTIVGIINRRSWKHV